MRERLLVIAALGLLAGCYHPPGGSRSSTTGGATTAASTTGGVCYNEFNCSSGAATTTGSCRAGQQLYCCGTPCYYHCGWYDTPQTDCANPACQMAARNGEPCPTTGSTGDTGTTGGSGTSGSGTSGGPSTSTSTTSGSTGSTGACTCDPNHPCASGGTFGGSTGSCSDGQRVYCAGSCCGYTCAWYDTPPPIHNACAFPQDGSPCPGLANLQGEQAFTVRAAAAQPHASYDVEFSLYESPQASTCIPVEDTRRLDVYVHRFNGPTPGPYPVASPGNVAYADVTLRLDGGQTALVAASGSVAITRDGPAPEGSLDVTFPDAGSLRGTFRAPACTP